MVTFVIFILVVALYAAFLLWCLAPLVRRQRRRFVGVLRVTMGALLLAANVMPLFAAPFLWPVSWLGWQAVGFAVAVVLFPHTLPSYVRSIYERSGATATVVDIAYPIEIAGVRYAPVARAACSTRRMIDSDKGANVMLFEQYPTVVGGDVLVQAGDATVALVQPREACMAARRGALRPGQPTVYGTSTGLAPKVYVIRGEADRTQLYALQYYRSAVTVDDIVLHAPEVIDVGQAPARDVIPLAAFWPMRLAEETFRIPDMIKAYQWLPGNVRPCVRFVTVTMDFRRMTPLVEIDKSELRDVAVARRARHCGHALAWRIPALVRQRLSPVGG